MNFKDSERRCPRPNSEWAEKQVVLDLTHLKSQAANGIKSIQEQVQHTLEC